jgi:RNA-binding protein
MQTSKNSFFSIDGGATGILCERALKRTSFCKPAHLEPDSMSLSEPQKRHLKKLAHTLKPVVMVGQSGVSESVLAEIEIALDHHELIKVKVSVGDRDIRDEMIGQILESSGAQLPQRIGNIAVLFRSNPKKKNPLVLPSR